MAKGAGGVVRANLSLLGSIAIWGSFFPLLAHLLETWDPYSNAAARALLGALVLLALAVARHGVRIARTRWPWKRVLALAGCGIVGFNLLMTLGAVRHADQAGLRVRGGARGGRRRVRRAGARRRP